MVFRTGSPNLISHVDAGKGPEQRVEAGVSKLFDKSKVLPHEAEASRTMSSDKRATIGSDTIEPSISRLRFDMKRFSRTEWSWDRVADLWRRIIERALHP